MLNDDIILNSEFSEEKFDDLKSKTETLYQHLNNKQCDQNIIYNIINQTNNLERLYIKEIYLNLYKKNIQDEFKNNKILENKFKDLCRMLFFSPIQYDCKQLHRSMHNFFNDENIICEIFATRPYWMLQKIDKEYVEMYKISLKQDIEKETKSEFKNCLLCILNTERNNEKLLNNEKCEELVKKLNSNLKKIGNNMELFIEIFCKLNREDLIEICRLYNKLYKQNLYDAINSNVSGLPKKLLKDILFGVINPSEFFSKKIYQSLQGLGTDTNMLNRIIISRSELDMTEIKQYYKLFREVEIEKDIEGDTSGMYTQLLKSLIQKS